MCINFKKTTTVKKMLTMLSLDCRIMRNTFVPYTFLFFSRFSTISMYCFRNPKKR